MRFPSFGKYSGHVNYRRFRWAQVALLLTACGYHVPPAAHVMPAPLVLPTTPETLWPAVIEMVGDYSLAIATIDRTSGLLQTGPMRSGEMKYWDCGHFQDYTNAQNIKPYPGVVVTRFTVTVTPVGIDSSRIRVVTNPEAGDCTSRGNIEKEMAEKIANHWRGK